MPGCSRTRLTDGEPVTTSPTLPSGPGSRHSATCSRRQMCTHPLAQLALRVHVLTGILALVAGFGAMLCTKGSTRHRRFGKLYVWLIALVAVTSGALAASIASAFLLSLTL